MPVVLGCLLLALASAPATTPAIPVKLLVADAELERAAEVLGYLRAELPELEVLTASDTPSQERLLAASKERVALLMLELRAGRIVALRPDLGTAITRVLPPETGVEAPYTYAVATLELIDLAAERRAPLAVAGTPRASRWAFGVLAGGELATGLGAEPSLLQLSAGLDLILRTSGRAYWWTVGPRVLLLGSSSKEAAVGLERFRVDYTRTGLGLRTALGLAVGSVDLGLALSGRLSWSRSQATDLRTDARVEESALLFGLGPGVEARYELGAGFALSLTVDALFTPKPVRYLVRDEVVTEDGLLRTSVALLVGWQSDSAH